MTSGDNTLGYPSLRDTPGIRAELARIIAASANRRPNANEVVKLVVISLILGRSDGFTSNYFERLLALLTFPLADLGVHGEES